MRREVGEFWAANPDFDEYRKSQKRKESEEKFMEILKKQGSTHMFEQIEECAEAEIPHSQPLTPK